MRGVAVACILIAVAAVQTTLGARLGMWQATPAALATFALLMLAARRHWRAEPASLKIGPDGLTLWTRAGRVIAQGRIAGFSQWSGRLLILVLADGSGRSRHLLIAADALGAGAFRELAVLGRHASRV
ncbi:hypothetical protein D0B32_16920 [Paraburkholderia sp. DHOC27]|nr:hypothetical protein D0B32_16920 [Paraburkholderia sp. DHOC27]